MLVGAQRISLLTAVACVVVCFVVVWAPWIFKFTKVDYPLCKDCKIHKGFYDSYLDIQNTTQRSVAGMMESHPNAKVYVALHAAW